MAQRDQDLHNMRMRFAHLEQEMAHQQYLERQRKETLKEFSMQTDLLIEPPVHIGSIMQSPLSVTDCERPPITLIVSAQSLKEQYQKDVKRQQ